LASNVFGARYQQFEECRYVTLLIDPLARGKGKCVDAAKFAVGRFTHKAIYGRSGTGVCRLQQNCEQRLSFAHG